MIKTAVVGASGYVGRHLLRAYRKKFADCAGTRFATDIPDLRPFDIRAPDLASLRLEETGHRAVLIASAKPNIAYCEQNRDAAYAVNVTGMLELVRQVGRTSMQVIFLSSDYVFDGARGGYDDGDAIAPTTEYGRQKALVEREIPSLAGDWAVLRLSKIYGTARSDGTLLDEIAGQLAGGREVRAAADQVFCPTHVDDLVGAILAVQERGLKGALNLCSPAAWSRADIADSLAATMNADRSLVRRVSLHDIPSMAGRPLNTSMRCSRLLRETGVRFVPLEEHIKRVASNWAA